MKSDLKFNICILELNTSPSVFALPVKTFIFTKLRGSLTELQKCLC